MGKENVVFEESQFFYAAPFIFLAAGFILALQLFLLPPDAERTIGSALYWLPVAILVFLLLVSLNFWRLRLSVANGFFEARYGLLARRIPLSEIVDVRMCELRFPNYWGLGIRWGFDGSTAYCTRFGRGVRLKLKRGRDLVVSTKDAAGLLHVLRKR